MSRGATEPGALRSPTSACRAGPSLGALTPWLRDERGFTLIELLWGAVLAIFVFAAITSFMIVSLKQGNEISSRAHASAQAQAGLSQLTRDLSDAMGSPQSVSLSQTASVASITFDIPNPNSSDAAEQVTWTCPYSSSPSAATAGACVRQVGGSSGVTTQQMAGIESATFTPSNCTPSSPCTSSSATDPAYIGITLNVEDVSQNGLTQTSTVAGSTTPIVLNAGVDLRNLS